MTSAAQMYVLLNVTYSHAGPKLIRADRRNISPRVSGSGGRRCWGLIGLSSGLTDGQRNKKVALVVKPNVLVNRFE